jgi:hypothetical protein
MRHLAAEIRREVGYVAGIATYVLAGELAVNEVLEGELPKPLFPDLLRETAPAWWNQLAGGAIQLARLHLERGDVDASSANLGQAVPSPGCSTSTGFEDRTSPESWIGNTLPNTGLAPVSGRPTATAIGTSSSR